MFISRQIVSMLTMLFVLSACAGSNYGGRTKTSKTNDDETETVASDTRPHDGELGGIPVPITGVMLTAANIESPVLYSSLEGSQRSYLAFARLRTPKGVFLASQLSPDSQLTWEISGTVLSPTSGEVVTTTPDGHAALGYRWKVPVKSSDENVKITATVTQGGRGASQAASIDGPYIPMIVATSQGCMQAMSSVVWRELMPNAPH